MNELVGVSAGRAGFHARQTFAGECREQKPARRNPVDSSRSQVEQGILVHLADRRTVGALHIIGVDLQLRLGIDLRVVREQQIAVRLLGVGLLRVLVDHNATVENAVRMPIENSVVKLSTARVRAGVLDQHVIVQVLMAVADK